MTSLAIHLSVTGFKAMPDFAAKLWA